MKNVRFRTLVISLLVLLLLPLLLSAAENPGYRTSQPPMLTTGVAGGTVEPIISVGDVLPNGYMYQSIPDGIGMSPNGNGTVDLFVAHETSLVPFPYNPTTGVGQSDFENAQVSKIRLHQGSMGVLQGWMMIDSDANYQRFCSSSLAGAEVGFKHPIFFGNEEATDFVSPPPLLAWPSDPTNQRQAGLVVALDTVTGKTYELPGLGRMNHENTLLVPGYDQVVAVTDDDTFSAPAAQFYMYLAADPDAFLADAGELYAFVVDNASVNDYGDMTLASNESGHFIHVPRSIALGDQTPLENWSNANNVFQFIRTEDIAYDKNNPRVLYIADTGEPRAIPDPVTGRLRRGPSGTLGPYPNGRIFKMVLNAADPMVVDSFTVLINADAGGYNNPAALHNPDNLDTSLNSLMIQEDPGSHNSYAPGAGPSARVWRYDLSNGALTPVAEVDQSLDPAAREGAWESSGILDASSVFGPGAWLVNVQAHSLWVESQVVGPLTFKREGGQLLLLVIPGS